MKRIDWLATVPVLCVTMLASSAQAAEAKHVQASLLADTDAIVPGKSFTLGVLLKMDPHWHTYWKNPGESGQATEVVFIGDMPNGLTFDPIQWPLPRKIDAPGGFSYGYEESVMLMIPMKAAENFTAKNPVPMTLRVSWLSCSGDTCIEGSADLRMDLPVAKESKPANAALIEQWRAQLPVEMTSDRPDPKSRQKTDPAAGEFLPELEVRWNQRPAKVEWFPESTPNVAIENVVLTPEGNITTIRYKPTVFKPDNGKVIMMWGVLIYEDRQGRHGLRHGFLVPNPKK